MNDQVSDGGSPQAATPAWWDDADALCELLTGVLQAHDMLAAAIITRRLAVVAPDRAQAVLDALDLARSRS